MMLSRTDECCLGACTAKVGALLKVVLRRSRYMSSREKSTTVPLETMYQGRSRDALLFIPGGLAPGTFIPLIFNYHGFTSSSERQQSLSNMNPVCEQRGCAVVYPNGWGVGGSGLLRSHNGGSCCGPANNPEDPSDDVGL
jgi:poly(3-hydroxybutyrate) depolymerase